MATGRASIGGLPYESQPRQIWERPTSAALRPQLTPLQTRPISLPGRLALARKPLLIGSSHERLVGRKESTHPFQVVPIGWPALPRHQGDSNFDVSSSYSSLEPLRQSRISHKHVDAPHTRNYEYLPIQKRGMTRMIIFAMKRTCNFILTPFGILVTIYCLNVVAWGGMCFLLILNAAPAMCHPTCSNEFSTREEWIEIDSRCTVILLAIMAFGLSPWRLRDLYYLMQYRILKREEGLRRLAGIHRAWVRLLGSDCKTSRKNSTLGLCTNHSSVPIPASKAPDFPLYREYAPPTKIWKLDFMIWMYVANIVFQAVLVGVMWGYNRFNRPTWASGVFVALTLGAAASAGLMSWLESRKVRKVEGAPVAEETLLTDLEMDAAAKTQRRDAWNLEHYLRLWREEKVLWAVIRA